MPPSQNPRQSPKQNKILAALSLTSYTRLLPFLELVHMPVGHAVYEPGLPINHLYFPTTCIAVRLYEMADGASTQIGVIGNEGLVGMSLLLGSETSPARVVALSAGNAYRIKAGFLKKEFESSEELRRLLLRFAQALITQTEQIAVCNRYHTIDQQLSYFLLMNLDRLSGNELHITHEQVAIMLGVRRKSITVAAHKLQASGAIRCRRGHLAVVDRQQLEASAGENYMVVRKEYERLLGPFSPPINASTTNASLGVSRKTIEEYFHETRQTQTL
ncbi:MAG: Crp/Fnr family transcriptional regulator [Pseudomonadota bacterium]|nr:Crp/Fnr family transcriptional regulator [Pseudomonadota bacterium]